MFELERVLREGRRGDDVEQLQEFLAAQGYDVGPIDGIFGPRTARAVRQFQEDQGISVDGIVGPETVGAINTVLGDGDGGDTGGGDTDGDPGNTIDAPILNDTSPAPAPEGSGENVPGLLGGATLVKVARPDADDVWYAEYEYPPGSGNFFSYQFGSLDQVKAALGSDFAVSGEWTIRVSDESYLTDPKVNIVDSAVEIIGLSGTFTGLITDAMREVALENGITDPTILGQFLSDPDIQLILAAGAMGEWSDARIQAEIRNTTFYQDVLYPGIDTFFQQGVADPEGEWARYSAAVTAGMRELGVEPDSDGSYRSRVGELLQGGVDATLFLEMVPTFIRASQNGAYRVALDEWVQNDLGQSITFDDVYDTLSGNPPENIRETVERANLTFHAAQRQLGLDPALIERIAAETDLSEADIAANFSNTELSILALGDAGLRRAGLTAAQVALSAFELPDTEGGTALEVQQRVRKFAIERGLMDDPKAQLFVGFNEDGTPNRPGLGRINPEGA